MTPVKSEIKKNVKKGVAVNQDFKDRNVELKVQWIEAKEDLAKAYKSRNVNKITIAENKYQLCSEAFIKLNKGLTYQFARVFANNNEDLAKDYQASAEFGMWEAWLKWDHTMNVTFATFARQYIKGRVNRTVRSLEYSHISQGDFNKRKDVREAYTKLEDVLGRTPTYLEIAKEAETTVTLVQRALSQKATSLDTPIGDGEGTLGDLVGEKKSGFSVDEYTDEVTDELFKELSELELWIMMGRVDLLGSPEQSLLEIADRLGIGREIARRVENKAKVRLVTVKLTQDLDRNPTIQEVGEALGEEVNEEFSKLVKSSFNDLHSRLIRAREERKGTKNVRELKNIDRRINRVGEEFLSNIKNQITTLGSTYGLKGNKSIAGYEPIAQLIFKLFWSWGGDMEVSFEAFLRRELPKMLSKISVSNYDGYELSDEEVRYMWLQLRKKIIV